MTRIRLFFRVAIIGLLACVCAIPTAHAIDLELVGENVLDGKRVYEVGLKPINSMLTTRYWAEVGDSDAKGGTYTTLEVGWVRQLDVRYYEILLYWKTRDPTKLTGVTFKHGDKNVADLLISNDEKQSVLSLNLKNIAEENIRNIQRVVLRYDHSHARKELDSQIKMAQGAGAWEAEELNTRAWYLATFPVDEVRDGKQALADAARAVHLFDCHGYRDTLAAAYAELGDFDNAIREQQRATDSLNQEVTRCDAARDSGEIGDVQYQAYIESIDQARRQYGARLQGYEERQPARVWEYPY